MVKRSMRTRLIFSYLMLIMLALTFLGSYTMWFFYRQNINNLTVTLLTQAEIAEQLIKTSRDISSVSSLYEQFKDLSSKTNVHIAVIDSNGNIILDPSSLLKNNFAISEIKSALIGKQTVNTLYNADYKDNWLYAAIPIINNDKIEGAICAATSLMTIEQGYKTIKSALFTALLLASLISILLSIKLIKKFMLPLEKITTVAEYYASGKLDSRVHIKTGDEFEILAYALNNLASSLDDKVSEIVAEKKKLELILEHIDNAVILLDKDLRLTTANRLAVETFKITNNMFGHYNVLLFGTSSFDQAIIQCLKTSQHNIIDLKINIRNTKRIFQVFIVPVITFKAEINGVLCVFHDITALQELHDRQADFVANASHELSTPLTVIKGFAETLLDGALQDPGMSKKFIEIIHNEAERMYRLVSDLLQLTYLESRDYKQHVKITPINPDNIFENIMQDLSPHCHRKSLTYSIEYLQTPQLILANIDWLKQLLVNLIENAIKYTPEKGKILLKYYSDQKNAYFVIQDTGSGIPAKDLPHIFERFYRVDKSRTRSAGGTGLGLAIVKFIVDILGGTITVKSSENIGTTFTVGIPLAQKTRS